MHLFTDPIVDIKDIEKALKVTTPTANALTKELINVGILKEMTGFSRNRVYILWEYFNCFN